MQPQNNKPEKSRHQSLKKTDQAAFTLIELIVSLAILAVLFLLIFFLWQNQLAKARDTRRKSDLERIRIAFEEYYNDHQCYPPADILETCLGEQLRPYLDQVPCDPLTNQPYCYVYDQDHASCGQTFRVLASFENPLDKIIAKIECDGESHCGWESECGSLNDSVINYTYGTASTNTTVLNPAASPLPSPSPTASTNPDASPSPDSSPSPSPNMTGKYACTSDGQCNVVSNPIERGCPITFDDRYCYNSCDNPDNLCAF